MNISKTTLVLLMVSGAITSTLSAVDWQAYKKAKTLTKEKRYKEAIELWQKTKANAKNDKDDAFYMEMAAKVAFKNLNDKEQAILLIKSIKNEKRRNVQLMTYLSPDEIIATFKDTDFSEYPKDIITSANYRLAQAFFSKKMFSEALGGFKKTLSSPGGTPSERGRSALIIGDIYLQKEFLDEKKAITYYQKSIASSKASYAWRCEAVSRLSSLLIKEKRIDDALKIDYENMITKALPYWKVNLSESYANVLSAANQKTKAIEVLNAAIKHATDSRKKIIQKKIEKLSESML